jgi:hypothetical protein
MRELNNHSTKDCGMKGFWSYLDSRNSSRSTANATPASPGRGA